MGFLSDLFGGKKDDSAKNAWDQQVQWLDSYWKDLQAQFQQGQQQYDQAFQTWQQGAGQKGHRQINEWETQAQGQLNQQAMNRGMWNTSQTLNRGAGVSRGATEMRNDLNENIAQQTSQWQLGRPIFSESYGRMRMGLGAAPEVRRSGGILGPALGFAGGLIGGQPGAALGQAVGGTWAGGNYGPAMGGFGSFGNSWLGGQFGNWFGGGTGSASSVPRYTASDYMNRGGYV